MFAGVWQNLGSLEATGLAKAGIGGKLEIVKLHWNARPSRTSFLTGESSWPPQSDMRHVDYY